MRLPAFLIIGAPRAGTSTLWHMLRQYPQLATWPKKEVHYFDRYWRRGAQWYADRFKAAAPEAVLFEATPAYLFRSAVPARVRQLLPDVKLVLLLRDPVARAVSHYWLHQDRFGTDPEVLIDGHHQCVTVGHYDVHLERWLEHYDRDRFLIFASEAFYDKPAIYTRHIATWAGGLDHYTAYAREFSDTYYDPLQHRKDRYGRPRIPKNVLAWLRLHYKAHNERLQKLLAPIDFITAYWDGRLHYKEDT